MAKSTACSPRRRTSNGCPALHCYEFFAGARRFERLCDEEPGTFYLTDFLARFFDRFVMGALMLDRHPELKESFFGNYRRLVYLSQTRDAGLLAAAKQAAETLGLEFHHIHCGYGALATSLAAFARAEREDPVAGAREICRMRAPPEPCSKTIISWRDIPSQVIVSQGKKRAKALLDSPLSTGHRPRCDAGTQTQRRCLHKRVEQSQQRP